VPERVAAFLMVAGDFGPPLIVCEALAVAAGLLARDAWRWWRGRPDG
jgi:hypothetical protein